MMSKASIFAGAIEAKGDISTRFMFHFKDKFPHLVDLSNFVFEVYGIYEKLDDKEALVSILNFGHDIAFYSPVVAIAKAWNGPKYVYHFNEPNPWTGRWEGRTCHLTDLAFLWHNYDEFLTENQRQVGIQFSTDLIRFSNGKAPWPAFQQSNPLLRTYGPSSQGFFSGVSDLHSSSAGRRTVISDLIEKAGADVLLEVFLSFLAAV